MPGCEAQRPAASKLADSNTRTIADCPAAILGYHYVLEGSNNGGRYIARPIRRVLGLGDEGTSSSTPTEIASRKCGRDTAPT